MVSQTLFNYKFKSKEDELKEIEESIELPLPEEMDAEELGYRLIDKHKIPCGVQEQFLESIKKFVVIESERKSNEELSKLQDEFHRNFAQNKSRILLELNRLNSFSNDAQVDRRKKSLIHQSSLDGTSNYLSMIKNNNNSFDTLHHTINESPSNEFRLKYHELIHSGYLTDALVRLEHSFALTLSNLVFSMEKAIKDLTEKQANEMEEKIKLIGSSVNEADINLLSHQHYQATDDLSKLWSTKIKDCKAMQKKDFLDWIDQVYDDFKAGEKDKILNSIKCLTDSTNQNLLNRLDSSSDGSESSRTSMNQANKEIYKSLEEPTLEESFTINLGSQLKSSHNLRLTAMDILDLCKMNFNDLNVSQPNPHRIHTAMSLYSNSSALVLIVDNRISSYGSVKSQFSRLCNLSTEFHFNELDEQLDEIRQEARFSVNRQPKMGTNDVLLEPGDFYVTKHSNLAKVHSVYHLVADDSVLSPEINSRHAVILGLRNILKISYLNDINTIFIPLLLINELNESITLQWCIKRAELVLKCVKGFMIEISALSPSNDESNNKTIQFLVPKSISEDLFQNLASMLSNIFRMNNPLVLNDLNCNSNK